MKINIIMKVAIPFICCICNFFFAQNSENIKKVPSFNYEKLSAEKSDQFLKLETDKLQLGNITIYTNSDATGLKKETTYEKKDGKLVFNYERGQKNDSKDSLVYEYQYSELPTYEYPELIEYKYIYPSDSLTIEVQTIGEHQIDSTFIKRNRNKLHQVIAMSEVTNRTYKGRTRTTRSIATTYLYNDDGKKIQELKIYARDGDSVQTRYEYIDNRLAKEIYKNVRMQKTETYKNDLLESVEVVMGDSGATTFYTYNKQKQEILARQFEGGKLVFSFKTTYENGLKTKYEMQDELDKKNLSFKLYDYDKKRKRSYEIALNYIPKEKLKHIETVATQVVE